MPDRSPEQIAQALELIKAKVDEYATVEDIEALDDAISVVRMSSPVDELAVASELRRLASAPTPVDPNTQRRGRSEHGRFVIGCLSCAVADVPKPVAASAPPLVDVVKEYLGAAQASLAAHAAVTANEERRMIDARKALWRAIYTNSESASAPPSPAFAFALGQLRHAYQQGCDGGIGDQRAFVDGLIAPAIRAMEQAASAPPSEPPQSLNEVHAAGPFAVKPTSNENIFEAHLDRLFVLMGEMKRLVNR